MLKRLMSAWGANADAAQVQPHGGRAAAPPRPAEPPDYAPPGPGVSIERSFSQNGFALVPQVFTRDEIAALRRAASGLLPESSPPYKPQFSSAGMFDPRFRGVFSNPRLIGTLRRLLGDDFVFINEFAIHDSHYAGWHSDTTSPEGKANHQFHWSPGFMVVNIGIYLQNNFHNGGGLDMVPGSFMRDDPAAIPLRRENGFPDCHLAPESEGDNYRGAVTIRSTVGDAVIFHLRTSHRSSVPPRPAQTEAERKFALFIIAGANNALTRRYRTWLDEYDKMNGVSRPAVPDEFRAFLNRLGHPVI